mmetsp:Transcript_28712/g.46241  ORF Transcript_28712/g.46241 Transcript_28712/m.46241 type:complete len:413 (-) Transcript_28712:306-1544(-)|eukprot:CAMPEP_0169072946 /NCGR_PEP_ID=MMETSP1015-20121227/6476_1 /TAXON_ID=342587 /ORGANISM="Karlodinium micrum, Strain CCMP2283" /LENGTH=412 /DNA_ID=CAMNT_0009132157 /DNA_START=60 /DNA_END=1298 /DNA_ORIENTATION=+
MGCASSASEPANVSHPQPQVCLRSNRTSSRDFHDEYLLGKKLGCGAYAQIRLAVKPDFCEIPKKYAVKIIDTKHMKEDARRFKRHFELMEESIWTCIGQHANCVYLHEVFHGESFSYLVMEKCASSLPRYIVGLPLHHKFTECNLGQILLQMLQGIAHLHSFQIVHADIKPDNVMMGGEYGNIAKLGDFGLAFRLPKAGKLKGEVGTAPYMSPEMICAQRYDDKTDIWSFGVTAYVLLFGTFPYMSQHMFWCREARNNSMKMAIRQGYRPAFSPARTSKSRCDYRTFAAVTFVKTLLSYTVNERPSALEALKLEFMDGIARSRHAVGVDLPSLQPMVWSAAGFGALTISQEFAVEEMDGHFNALQVEKHGVPLPNPRLLGKLVNNPKRHSEIKFSRHGTCVGSELDSEVCSI